MANKQKIMDPFIIRLPKEIKNSILVFDKRFVVKSDGSIWFINKLLKEDTRYEMLETLSIKQNNRKSPFGTDAEVYLRINRYKKYYIRLIQDCIFISIFHSKENSSEIKVSDNASVRL